MARRSDGTRLRRLVAALALAAVGISLPDGGPASADRGDLDVTFAGTGQVRTGVNSALGQGYAVAVDPIADRVYIAAIEFVAPFGPHQAYVAAYTSDGVLDATFGTGGVARTGISASADAGVGLGVSPDGQRVYLATLAQDGAFADQSYVAAFTAGGVLDDTFSDDGLASTGLLGSPEGGYSLAVDATTGRVYVASLQLLALGDTAGQQYVAAFAPSGELDPAFSGDGITLGGPGYFRGGFALALNPSTGHVYLASTLSLDGSGGTGLVAAWDAAGQIDSPFGDADAGAQILPLPAEANGRWGLAVDPARNRIYAASYEASSGPTTYPFVAALTIDGDPDPSFGDSGIARTIHAGIGYSGQSVAIDPADGTVFLITYSNAGIFPNQVYVAAFTSAGAFDTTFGDAGLATTGLNSSSDAGSRGVFDPATGRVYVASYAGGDGLGAALSAFQTIADPPQLSIADVSQAEGTGGSTDFEFVVSLSTPAPAGGVTFDIATADNTATVADGDYVASSLTGQTIPAGSSTYTFSVTVGADADVESDETFFVNVTNVTGADVLDGQATGTIANDDAPAAGVVITPTTGLTTTEAGGTATFDVVLTRQPTGDVTVDLASSDPTEGTVSPAALTFGSADWNVPQTATVTGVDDAVADGDVAYSITSAVDSADLAFAAVDPADVSVTNTDDDIAGVQLAPPTGLAVSEAGGAASLSVALTSQPTADVVIELTSDDPTEATVSPSTLTFTPAAWGPQVASVTGVDDDVVDGPGAFSIGFSVTSADLGYAALSVDPVDGINADDDVAAPTTTTEVPDTTAPPAPTTVPPAPTPPPTAPPTTQGVVGGLPVTGGSPLGGLAGAAALLGLGLAALLGTRTHTRPR
jgi:hypothetical protein